MMHQSLKAVALTLLALALGCRSTSKTEQSSPSVEKKQEGEVDVVRVAIGTQDTTINCATGGPLVRELHLLEKYLPKDGRYRAVKYEIHWENQPTGAQLNSKYLANQLDIVQMADFPSVLGATALKAAGDKVQSLYIATLSAGIKAVELAGGDVRGARAARARRQSGARDLRSRSGDRQQAVRGQGLVRAWLGRPSCVPAQEICGKLGEQARRSGH